MTTSREDISTPRSSIAAEFASVSPLKKSLDDISRLEVEILFWPSIVVGIVTPKASTKNLIYRSCRDFPGEIGSRQIIAKEDIRKAFMSAPLVIKMKTEVQPCPYIPKKDKLVPLSEVWDVLEI